MASGDAPFNLLGEPTILTLSGLLPAARFFISSEMLTCLNFFFADCERLLLSDLSFFGDDAPSPTPPSSPSSAFRFFSLSRFSWKGEKKGENSSEGKLFFLINVENKAQLKIKCDKPKQEEGIIHRVTGSLFFFELSKNKAGHHLHDL